MAKMGKITREMLQRYKGTHRKLPTILIPRVTRLIFTQTCYTPPRSWQWNPSAEPRGTPGAPATTLHLLAETQMMPGTEASPFERNPKSWLSPSAFQMAFHMPIRMFRKCFPLCNQEKHFFLWSLLPLSLPPSIEPEVCVCGIFSQIIHDWSFALFALVVDTLQRADKDGAQWCTCLLVPSRLPAPLQTCFWVSLLFSSSPGSARTSLLK